MVTSPYLIGIAGYKRAGKDSVAGFMRKEYPHFRSYAFAEPIRQILKAMFGWSDEYFEGELKETIDPFWGISPRQALQFMGTEIGRRAFADRFPEFAAVTGGRIWIRRVEKEIDEHRFDDYLITDVRFHNELDALEEYRRKGRKVLTIAVNNPDCGPDGHDSEAEVEGVMERCGIQLYNTSTLFFLQVQVTGMMMEEGIMFPQAK